MTVATRYEQWGFDRLSVRDRLELIECLWSSLPPEISPEDVPEWHRELLNERYQEAIKSPGQGQPWRDVLTRIGNRQ